MRIRGGGRYSGDRTSRSESFKRSHRVGQKVRGRILRWEDEDLAWVNIDGDPLLANIPSGPAPGSVLAFKVISLNPQIHLQALHGGGGGNLAPALTGVMGFTKARQTFESLIRPHAASLQDQPLAERILTLTELLRTPEIGEAHARVQTAVDGINTLGADRTLSYTPLLLPTAREQATFVKRGVGEFFEVVHEFTLGEFGDCQLVCLHKGERTSYRIKVGRAFYAKPLTHLLQKTEALPEHAEFLGAEVLTGAPGGMLSRYFSG
ncbi:hypothetical protein [Desulfovibrio oxyclinae]|uniref:hypothetical protein n=1 Tax=Desulfovibrio oxyclinae TaxID=63560 RepID=UPI000366BB8F|nr:hypothetical protein [Desulfovibrio oxyclinae]